MLSKRWLTFWFEPSSPTDLGVSRVVFFAGLLLVYGREDFSGWGAVSPAFWMPLPAFTALHLTPLSPETLGGLQIAWRAALALSAIGLLTRLSMAVSFALGFYLLGLPHNFGHTFHFDALLVVALAVLAGSRAGDACSIDAVVAGRPPRHPSGEYTWPIRMIWVAMSLVFLAAGLAKLRYGGVAWVTSTNMALLLTRAAYHVSDADPLTRAGLWIAERRWLASALAGAALAIELGFISALFSRIARLIFVPAAFALLVGIRVLMGPTFGGFLLANVFWVPWRTLGARVAARVRLHEPRRTATPAMAAPNASHAPVLTASHPLVATLLETDPIHRGEMSASDRPWVDGR